MSRDGAPRARIPDSSWRYNYPRLPKSIFGAKAYLLLTSYRSSIRAMCSFRANRGIPFVWIQTNILPPKTPWVPVMACRNMRRRGVISATISRRRMEKQWNLQSLWHPVKSVAIRHLSAPRFDQRDRDRRIIQIRNQRVYGKCLHEVE